MDEKSENPTTTPDNVPITPENATIPDAPQAEEAPAPAEERPKTRGRPRGSKDGKPRIRRVPVVIEQAQQEPAEPAAPVATRKVQIAEPAVAEEPPEPPPKSPRTLHREHVQALAAERRALAQAKQSHYESLFTGISAGSKPGSAWRQTAWRTGCSKGLRATRRRSFKQRCAAGTS